MSRLRTVHRCTECSADSPRWTGRCGTCGAWNSLVERPEGPWRGGLAGGPAAPSSRVSPAGGPPAGPVPITGVDAGGRRPRSTGVGELDRVLSGGLVAGSVTLLGGEPGIGKSTLVLQALAAMAGAGARALLVSAEESTRQVRLRADRLGALVADLWLVCGSSLPELEAAVGDVRPDVMVVDSIQTVADPELGSAPGTVAQVRGCAQALVGLSKSRGMATVLVGHVTKEGALAGPRVLEHVVDTVLSFEGERHHALRLLRAVKHRFGPTGELGLFEMVGTGLQGVPDPSGLFLGDRRPGVPGGVVLAAMEGQRPLLVELQALTAPSSLAMPRRSAQGLDAGRLALLLAVLDRRAGVRLGGADVFASVVGGVRVTEPAADLALALALASAFTDRPLPDDLVVCGEVGLGGELRQVAQSERRMVEAARLGFRRALVPASTPAGPGGMEVVRAASLAQALAWSGLQ